MCYSALVKSSLKAGDPFGEFLTRIQLDEYREYQSKNPTRFAALAGRIFPGTHAPVSFLKNGRRCTELMRYGAYAPAEIKDPRKYTTFNARRDNLDSPFWSTAFMRHHGFVVLQAFYEWVEVKDLLAAGVVTVAQVKEEFRRQAEERKAKILASGKKYAPTPTEKKDPRFRKIIIEFKPEDGSDLYVPVIFNRNPIKDELSPYCGFAIVTDEPTPEIAAAGHDRCPIILREDAIAQWLDVGRTKSELEKLLVQRQKITFRHGLPLPIAA